MRLGAGRVSKDSKIDYNAGIILKKNVGSYAKKHEVLALLYGDNRIDVDEVYKAFKMSYFKVKKTNIILEVLG